MAVRLYAALLVANEISMTQVPFSARNSAKPQLDGEFPKSARLLLRHLLLDLVERQYVKDWRVLAREAQRAARAPPGDYRENLSGAQEARHDVETLLDSMPWQRVLDFVERLHAHLPSEVYRWENDEQQVVVSRSDIQKYITDEVSLIFLAENLAYVFEGGQVHRRGRRHTVDRTERASVVLGDARLGSARQHYVKAMDFFAHPTKPDYQNTVKEAVCAVEAAGKALFPQAGAATLGDLIKWLVSEGKLPKSLGHTLTGLYGFRSGGEGVGHGGTSGGEVTSAVAEYALAVAASQIIYLYDVAARSEREVPF